MALIITPAQLNQRAELYHTLGTLLAAGLTAPKALEQLERNPPARSLRVPIGHLREYLRQGHSVGSAAAQMHGWMPAFDAALVDAGDRSGRLDACFKLLAVYYKARAEMARQVISDLIYPAALFHFAVVLFPFIDFIQSGRVLRNVLIVIATLLPIYIAVAFLILAGQGRRGETWRGWIEKVLRPIPVLGVARRSLALARLAAALEALLNAGVVITNAWDMAVAASGSPALGRAVSTWKEPLENGATPAELVNQSREFPELFASLYQSGEISGQLDDALTRLHTHYLEEGTRKMRLIAQWTPKAVYFGVMLIVAWRVLAYYIGYFNELKDVMDMK